MYKYKLSIVVIVYNHERYIYEALDSIKKQEKDFSYEILVGEDCSNDNTRNLLRKYDSSSLDNFKIYYRKNNMGALNNLLDLCEKAAGEYIILLEGDDFWVDPCKLKKQVKFLDENKEYIAVAHKCQIVDEYSNFLPYSYSAECYKDEYTLKEFRKGILPGQTATMMYRNIYKDKETSHCLKVVTNYPGDRRFAFLLAANGKVKCWKEKMSAYRHVILGGSSHSATIKEDVNYLQAQLEFYQALYQYAVYMNKSEFVKKISAQCYYKVLFRDQFRRYPIWSRQCFMNEFLKEKRKLSIWGWIIYSILIYPIERFKNKHEIYMAKKIQTKSRNSFEVERKLKN